MFKPSTEIVYAVLGAVLLALVVAVVLGGL